MLPDSTKPLPEPILTYQVRPGGIHLRAISQEMLKVYIFDMNLEITNLSLHLHLPGANELTHWGRDKMAAILQTTYSNAFSWMKMYKFWLRFHWNFFPRVQITIFHHCFRWWLGAGQAPSHYLKQWWLVDWRINASLVLNELIRDVQPCLGTTGYHTFQQRHNLNAMVWQSGQGVSDYV